ncbi:hypothetical protein EHS13_31365 [Paenibacillus psychroresistens]|uniref:Uncharacterized protein n=1 Tax=Paenibacillus psychroresistens TaxID=1778678 RepID=A0A6B8RV89_9BACL|nr:hypothetical protein [Paenibacillus psychroresistens]QGQ99058.1 hypothetical protein EHS13_31365 [Paenibacillus psychroresistens]
MKTKQIIITLGILLVVSATIGQLTLAAKPVADVRGQAQSAIKGDPQGDGHKQGSKKPKKAGSGSKEGKPPVGNGDVSAAVYGDNSVVISGGFVTDPQDHGRPVVLIAAALGVPTEVFRDAFSGVTPAGQGSGGPTSEEAQKNKAALLKVLAPYGITNERLDEVSNYYRYNGSKGETWKVTKATATAIVTNGVVTGIKITNPGSGYSSNATITVNGPNGKITATATVVYTKDFKTNGSISAITIK